MEALLSLLLLFAVLDTASPGSLDAEIEAEVLLGEQDFIAERALAAYQLDERLDFLFRFVSRHCPIKNRLSDQLILEELQNLGSARGVGPHPRGGGHGLVLFLRLRFALGLKKIDQLLAQLD